MGIMHVPVTIKAPNRRRTGYKALFLVDTGAIDSVVPASALLKAGIQPVARQTYELADGASANIRSALPKSK